MTPFEDHVLSGYSTYGTEELDLVEGQNRWAQRVAAETQVITESRYLVEGNLCPRKGPPWTDENHVIWSSNVGLVMLLMAA